MNNKILLLTLLLFSLCLNPNAEKKNRKELKHTYVICNFCMYANYKNEEGERQLCRFCLGRIHGDYYFLREDFEPD